MEFFLDSRCHCPHNKKGNLMYLKHFFFAANHLYLYVCKYTQTDTHNTFSPALEAS